jgi:hypothetical protein
MYKIKFNFADGTSSIKEAELIDSTLTIKKDEVSTNINSIEVLSIDFESSIAEDNYFVIPSISQNGPAAQIFFKERQDIEKVIRYSTMPIYGCCSKNKTTLAIVCGMELDYELVVGVKNNRYYMYPRFLTDNEELYEDIVIKFFTLSDKNSSYQGIAKFYRQFQLERGACTTLKERSKLYPALAKSLLGPEVRIRLAWKEVPSPVPEQTVENEPPIHVALTFAQCDEIIEEFHKQGIKNAEFCLVGFNKSGHDGRFPDIFPIEPLLGGEAELKKLIEKAKSLGYLICGHTNILDSYKIAKRWSAENCLKDKNGELHQEGNWGGGKSYFLCAKQAHLNYAIEDMENLKNLGFHGTHYFDVMSISLPPKCYDEKHPLSRKEMAYWRGESLRLAREKIGASASEGAFDFCIKDLDYALYTVFYREEDKCSLWDKEIPLWPMVYHGIIHYNMSTDTVNANIKSNKELSLINLAFGGRPVNYFYAKFMSAGVNWMGEEDLIFKDKEQLSNDIAKIKKEYQLYQSIADLQLNFIEDYEEIAPKIVKVTYDNNAILYFNMTENDYQLNDNETLKSYSLLRK